MENTEDQDFHARPYQVDLLQTAIERNTIIFLPTGSGKTFIALQLLKYLSKELEQKLDEGGKRSVFLVNTVPLVEQQANFIRTQTFIKDVGEYTGAKNVDDWSREKWNIEISKHKVLVMTTQILVDILCHGYIRLSDINLIIMDECHHTSKNHPMKQLMAFYKEYQASTCPRILGLTATLLNASCKPENVSSEVENLESSMQSTIATVDNMESVLGYSTNPRERIETYENSELDPILKVLIQELEDFKVRIFNVISTSIEPTVDSMIYMKGGSKGSRDTVCNIIKDLIEDINTFGAYGTFESAKIRHLEIEKLKRITVNKEDNNLYCQLITIILYIKKEIRKFVNSEDVKCVYNKSTPKLVKLLNIVKDYAPEKKNGKLPLKGIIFVQRRFTANILYQIFKALSRQDVEFKFIKPEFVVGMSGKCMVQSTENALERKWCKKALLKFRYGDANLLIASNVVEEGIDVPRCTLVIRFDNIPNYCSYTQSKGRARSKESEFISLVCSDDQHKFKNKYEQFKNIEQNLCKLLVGKTGSRQAPVGNIDYNDFSVSTYRTSEAQATMVSAISLVNRYCSSLPQDMFTNLTVNYFREQKTDETYHLLHRVMLQFPIMCKIRYGIKGEWMPTLKDAKRSAALKAIEILHKEGELDEHLMPIVARNPTNLSDLNNFFDHWLKDEPKFDSNGKHLSKPGTKNRIRIHKKVIPDALQNTMIVAEQDIYLHVFEVTTDYNKPSELDNRAFKFYNLLNSPQSYAILSAKPFPDLCDYPLFLGVGKMSIKLITNSSSLSLKQSEIEKIKAFNLMLYRDVLEILKTFLVFDVHNDSISFLVCPVDKNHEIDWNVVERFPKLEPRIVPSHQQRMEMVIDPEQYRDAIVVPWYRTITARTVYVVTRVCEEMSPYSNFPTESFDSYNSYFRDKYHLEAFHTKQPLLEVKPLSFNKLNCLKPRVSKNKRYFNIDLESSTFDEHLVPEFCWLIKYPAVLYLKAAMLPSMLYRLTSLMKAYQLAYNITTDLKLPISSIETSPLACKIGLLCDPNEPETVSATSSTTPNLDASLDSSSSNDDSESRSSLKVFDNEAVNNYEFELQKLNKEFSWDDAKEPVDFHRQADDMLSIDMDYYCNFIKKDVEEDYIDESVPAPLLDCRQLAICYSDSIEPLHILNKSTNALEIKDMLAVLTAKTANDICDLERLETLGDSFLKFAVTLYLTEKFRDLNEGHLTSIKGQIIGNKNLLYCGLRKNLPGYMNMYDFAPCADWVPPGFTLVSEVKDKLIEKEISAEVLYGNQASVEEILSGYMLPETVEKMIKCIDNVGEERHDSVLENVLGILKVPDKSVADCIEALIGQFLLSYGLKTSLVLLGYLKIVPPSNELHSIMETEPMPAKLSNECSVEDIDFFIPGYKSLEQSLGYVFKDRSYLLQALTHASFAMNRLTDCYQRLEFVGDSILDFLITCHIYQHCGLLSPGDLTDLRSSLVNNNTFASLTVRYGFHVHLLALNPTLNDSINKFVSFQHQRGHKVDLELLNLLEEKECSLAESVDVPKVLGDIFESLACAVFLDCGKDLNIVWDVFYKLMRNEINTFSDKVPKQVVRLLYESNCKPRFGEAQVVEKSDLVVVPLYFSFEGKVHTVYGAGVNKHYAKKAASKIALQIMGQH